MSNVASMAEASTRQIVEEFMADNEELFAKILSGHPDLARVPVAILRDAYALLTSKEESNDFIRFLGGPFRLDYEVSIHSTDKKMLFAFSDGGYRLDMRHESGRSRSIELTPEIKARGKDLRPFMFLEVAWRGKLPPLSVRIPEDIFFKTSLEIFGEDEPTPLLYGVAYLADTHLNGSRLNLGTKRTAFSFDPEKLLIGSTFVDRRMDYHLTIDIKEIQRQEALFAERHS
ncbi:MAG TPA: hypothetical protein VN081_03075 [Dongiaceae bacterium]|nr:hypothetical protein [Dongiaceae bacterium]